MKIKLVSLLKVFVVSFFLIAVISANAEYYLVYSDSVISDCNSCVPHHRYVRHHYYHHYTHHRTHGRCYVYNHRRSNVDMKVYYAWRVYPAPGCTVGNTCRGSCNVRYAGTVGCGRDYDTRGYYVSNCGNGNCGNYDNNPYHCYRSEGRPGTYHSCDRGCPSQGCSKCQYEYARYVDPDAYNDYNYDTSTADDY